MNTILLATDGSDSAAHATTLAIALARATGWPLQILCVETAPTWVMTSPALIPEALNAEHEHAKHVLDTAVRTAETTGVHPTTILRQGDAAVEICKAADAQGEALIVLGSHGRGPFGRALLGSVSARVLHESAHPVLVARDKAEPVDRHGRSTTDSVEQEGRQIASAEHR